MPLRFARLRGVFLLALASLVGTQEARAGYIFNAANGHYYGLTDTRLNWDQVEAQAIAAGGHLASITSQAEQEFLVNNFVIPSTPGGDRQGFWIGATDAAVEASFVWTTGEPFTYSNWHSGEPNNVGNEDFVVFNFHYGVGVPPSNIKGTWNDASNNGSGDGPFFGIIELTANPVPEPSSLALALCAATALWHRARSRRNGLALRGA
jgi:hypothetical protein